MNQIVVFTLDDQLFALPLHSVLQVIHAIEIRHLPNSPEIIAGIINVKGKIIPVIDLRKRFGFKSREIDPDDRFLIVHTGKREAALMADTVAGVQQLDPGQSVAAAESAPFAGFLRGVAKVEEQLILIYDLEKFLSLDEEHSLDQALLKET
jgi:purine-binding chemotaxis protein CheW